MRFWDNLISVLKDISNKINEIAIVIFNYHDETNLKSNVDPVVIVKTKPIIILNSNVKRKKLIIQNIGLEPCYIKLDSEITKDDYHFVLAPDTSPNFGNGGSITLDNWNGKVWAICEKETKLSVLEY